MASRRVHDANGALAGLVGITAGCDAVSLWGALAIGVICGFVVTFGIEFIDHKLRVDDPVGASGVHALCGATGTLMVGIFATDGGLLYGGGLAQLGVQALGVAAVAAWTLATTAALFKILSKTVGLRVDSSEEIAGLDINEHGSEAYADFQLRATDVK
jgi:Amt family ammonium transporter